MYNSNQEEQEILKFWEDNQVFEKSISSRSQSEPYHFYDGPPFATGLPHYGHIVASLMKDAVPRYWTMKGKRVERKWGWDCHGLPVENIIEKELDLASKKDIEDYGVDKFNEACRATVLKYATEWKKTVNRMGRWVDMENDYKTMDPGFMESVWWVFRQLWDKGLIYKDYKAMHICPRCSTTLSNFEVTQGYKDIKDISVIGEFRVKNPEKHNLPENTFVLAWTTTPWTLPGNVLLAVGADVDYVLIEKQDMGTGPLIYFVLAKERLQEVLKDSEYKIVKEIKGIDLVGIEYEPLFPYYKDTPNAF
jgi:isoleucyl-tRNA synthetase